MAVSKVILNGTTLIDVTDKTVTAATLVSPNTALKNDGTTVTGSLVGKTSSDVTVSGATVTIPSGVYSSQVEKSVSSGTAGTPSASKGTVSNHSVSVTPTVTNTTGYITGGTKTGTAVTVSASELASGTKTISASGTTDVTNYASASVAAGSATISETTITANPNISVSSGGLITAAVVKNQAITPTVTAGYVSSGTSGTIQVSGSNTKQLTVQAAQTITPTTTDQTIASGKYLTGTQTIKGDSNLVAANIAEGVSIFGVTGTHSGGGGGISYGTFSISANSSVAASRIGYITIAPIANYEENEYFVIVNTKYNPSTAEATSKWILSDDGYMYVSFYGSSDSYWPIITATSGTATVVKSVNGGAAYPTKSAREGPIVVYKISDGAVLSASYANYN